MGLFTTRQLLGYTEQKVKFRALFLELFFRRTVNFHTEEVMLEQKLPEKRRWRPMSPRLLKEKCCVIAVVKPACYVRATSSRNTNLITSRRLSASR